MATEAIVVRDVLTGEECALPRMTEAVEVPPDSEASQAVPARFVRRQGKVEPMESLTGVQPR